MNAQATNIFQHALAYIPNQEQPIEFLDLFTSNNVLKPSQDGESQKKGKKYTNSFSFGYPADNQNQLPPMRSSQTPEKDKKQRNNQQHLSPLKKTNQKKDSGQVYRNQQFYDPNRQIRNKSNVVNPKNFQPESPTLQRQMGAQNPYDLNWANSMLKEHFKVALKKDDKKQKWIIRRVKLNNQRENYEEQRNSPRKDDSFVNGMGFTQNNYQQGPFVNLNELMGPLYKTNTQLYSYNVQDNKGEKVPSTAPVYNQQKNQGSRKNSGRGLSDQPNQKKSHQQQQKVLKVQMIKALPVYHVNFAKNLEKVSYMNKMSMV